MTIQESRLIDRGDLQEKQREAEMASRIQGVESSLSSARRGEQGGISEPQIACVTLNFSDARPYLFPTNRSQVEKGNKRRVTDVKGAERISFSVCRAAFLLLHSVCYRSRSDGRL